jgi:thioredoxin-dependent peroxiredoxin
MTIGEQIPEISAPDQEGKLINFSDYIGNKLIVFFYPADMTPGCTVEACNLRDNYQLLKNEGFELLGVSTDSVRKHQKFIEKYKLPFTLIADEDKKVVRHFGVYGPKTFMGKLYEGTHRKTFIFDEKGVLVLVIEKVKTKDHAAQILEEMSGL